MCQVNFVCTYRNLHKILVYVWFLKLITNTKNKKTNETKQNINEMRLGKFKPHEPKSGMNVVLCSISTVYV